MEFDLAVIWRNKAVLVACMFAGAAVGLGYLCFATPSYMAQARVLVQPQGIAPETQPRGRIDPEFLPTQAETIRSPVTISRALESTLVTPPPGADLETFDPVQYVLKGLKVTPILKANVLTVGYRSADAMEAQEVISSIVDAYRAHVSEHDKGEFKADIEVIAARESSLRNELEEAQKEYDALVRASPLLGQGTEATAQANSQLNRVGNQLAEVRLRRAEWETRLNVLDDADRDYVTTSTSEPTAVDGETRVVSRKPSISHPSDHQFKEILKFVEGEDARQLQQTNDRLRFAELQVAQLDKTYGPLHPDLIAARSEVSELALLKQQRLENLLQSWRRQLVETKAVEKELEGAVAAEQQKARLIEADLVQEEFLRGNVDRIEQLHSAASAQLTELRSAEHAFAAGRTSIQVRVLDGPTLIDDMTWPKPKRLLPAAACFGLAAGIFLVLIKSQSERSNIPLDSHPIHGESRFAAIEQEGAGVEDQDIARPESGVLV